MLAKAYKKPMAKKKPVVKRKPKRIKK